MTESVQKWSESIDNDASSIPTQFYVFLTVTSVTGHCYILTFQLCWRIRKSGTTVRHGTFLALYEYITSVLC